jgi:hypothetical protein
MQKGLVPEQFAFCSETNVVVGRFVVFLGIKELDGLLWIVNSLDRELIGICFSVCSYIF